MSPLCLVRDILKQIGKAFSSKELVLAVVKRPGSERLGCIRRSWDAEHFLQNVDVVRDREQIPAVLVGEQIVELVEACPRDTAQAERTGLMCSEEDAVLGGWTTFCWGREELLDAVDFSMQKGRDALIVCRDCHWRQVWAIQNCSSEDLASRGHASTRQRHDLIFNDVKKRRDESLGGVRAGHCEVQTTLGKTSSITEQSTKQVTDCSLASESWVMLPGGSGIVIDVLLAPGDGAGRVPGPWGPAPPEPVSIGVKAADLAGYGGALRCMQR